MGRYDSIQLSFWSTRLCILVTIFNFSILSSCTESKYVLATRTANCPCEFTITTPRNAPPLDFIVDQPSTSSKSVPRNLIQIFSRYSQRSSEGIVFNRRTILHRLGVPFTSRVRLSIESRGRLLSTSSRNILQPVQIKKVTNYTKSCPILLPEHPPSQPNSLPAHIIGGSPVNTSLAKYLAAIITPVDVDGDESADGYSFCSGVIISPRFIITAAHCQPQPSSTIFIGLRNIENGNESNSLEVESVHIHPNFNGSDHGASLMYDIAYIKLSADIDSSFGFMKLNSLVTAPITNSVVRSAGYGSTIPDVHAISHNTNAFQVDVVTFSNGDCSSTFSRGKHKWDSTRLLCAGYSLRQGCGVCVGDSGGPLIQYDTAGEPVLVGIAIAVVLCGSAGYPSLYTRIAGFVDFLPMDDVVSTNELNPVLYSESTPNANPEMSPSSSTPGHGGDGTSDVNIQSKMLPVIIIVVSSAIIGLLGAAIIVYKVSRRNT